MSKYIVLGATSGIGSEVCKILSESGDYLVMVGRNHEKLDSLMNSVLHPQNCSTIVADVSNINSMSSIFDKAVEDSVKLDGMIFCVGKVEITPLRSMNLVAAEELFRVNYFSFISAVSQYSKKKYSNSGSIVAVSAANAHYPQKCMSIYAASKAAIEASVKTMAVELAEKNIAINCVIPGAVDTEIYRNLSDEQREITSSKQLLGVSLPKDVANAIIYLLKDGSRIMTGRSMYVDGGLLGQ